MKADAIALAEATVKGYLFGPVVIDIASRQILRNGQVVVVPSKAFDALIYLAARPDRNVSKEELINSVWKDMYVAEGSLVHTMSVLRRALGDDSTHPQVIVTIPRMGYRLKGPVQAVFEPPCDSPSNAAAIPTVADNRVDMPIRATLRHARWQRQLLWALLLPVAFVMFLLTREAVAPRPLPYGAPVVFNQPAPEGTTIEFGGIVSPDSRYMVLVARDQKAGQTRLYLRQLDSPGLRPVVGTEGASHPFWSPTSDRIGFFVNGVLKTVDLLGDIPKVIAAVPVSAGGGAWSSSGPILFSDWQTGLYRVDPTGGPVSSVITVDRSQGELVQKLPQFLPDGRHFLFFLRSANASQTGGYIGSLDSSRRIRIPNQSSSPVIYSSPGYLLYVQDDILMAQRFDSSRLEITGKPMIVARNVPAPDDSEGKMISASANMLTFRLGAKTHQLAWFERSGERAGSIPGGNAVRNPIFSRDQKQLLSMGVGQGLWIFDLARNAATRLGDGVYPLWSPDGNQIAFESYNCLTLFLRNIDGPVRDRVLVNDNERKVLNDWSRAGNYLVYTTLNPTTKLDLVLLPMSGDKKPTPLLHTPFNESQGRISPDGHWIAYVSDESGSNEVYLQQFPSLGEKRIVSVSGGVEPIWRRDGKELFYLSPDRAIVSVPFQPTAPPVIGRPKPLFRAPINTSGTFGHYAVTSDGQRFMVSVEEEQSYLSPITVMVNWIEGLANN